MKTHPFWGHYIVSDKTYAKSQGVKSTDVNFLPLVYLPTRLDTSVEQLILLTYLWMHALNPKSGYFMVVMS